MKAAQVWDLLKLSASAWIEDRAPSQGAALSYYTLFSISPLLLIVIAVAGLVFGADAARGGIVQQLDSLVGSQGAKAIETLLENAAKPKQGVISTVVGSVLLLVGATTVLAELQEALDRIWRAPTREKVSGIWGWLRSRVVSLGMILGIGFLLVVSLVVSAAIAAVGGLFGTSGLWEAIAEVVNFVLSFAVVTGMFALIYRYLPRVRIEWHDVWIGAAVTSLLFAIGKTLIGLYIGKSSVASAFGAAGSMVVLLVWVYYSAQIFLLGAEFTAVFARNYGSLKTQERAASPPVAGTEAPLAASQPTRYVPAASALQHQNAAQGTARRPEEEPASSRVVLGALILGATSALAAEAAVRLRRTLR
jgi:membrane protein